MSRFDKSEVLTPGFLIAPAVYDDDNTEVSFDIGQNRACTILLGIGIGGITFNGTNKVEFKLTHSDDDSEFEAVDVDHLVGVASVGDGGIVKTLNAAHAAASLTKIGYIGGKQYLRLLADFSGTHGTGTPIAAVAVSDLPIVVDPPSA